MRKGQINPAIRDKFGRIISWKKRNRSLANAYARILRKRNPEKMSLAASRYALETKYGLSPELKRALIQLQDGLCAICCIKLSENCAVDHSHIDDYVRGMLCKPCNSALGLFKDNPDILRRAADYLDTAKEIAVEPTVEDFEIATRLLESINGRKSKEPITL